MGNISSPIKPKKRLYLKKNTLPKNHNDIKQYSLSKFRRDSITQDSQEAYYSGTTTNSNKSTILISEGNIINRLHPSRLTKKLSIIAKDLSTSSSSSVSPMEKQIIQFNQPIKPSSIEMELLNQILSDHYLFKHADTYTIKSIINSLSKEDVKPNSTVYKENTPVVYFYIITNGKLQLIHGDQTRDINECEVFGEWEIIHNISRQSKIISQEGAIVWKGTNEKVNKMINDIRQEKLKDIQKVISNILTYYDYDMINLISQGVNVTSFKENTLINPLGNPIQSITLIVKGEISIIKSNEEIKILHQDDIFGYKETYNPMDNQISYLTKTNCLLYSIPFDYFQMRPELTYPNDLTTLLLIKSLKESQYIKSINNTSLLKIASLFTVTYHSQGDIVFKKGQDMNQHIYIILEGNLINSSHDHNINLEGQILFESELYHCNSILLTNNLIASPDCLLATADLTKIEKTIGGTIRDIVKKRNKIAFLRNLPVFRCLNDDKLNEIEKSVSNQKYDHNVILIKQGDICDKLYIIKSGEVDVFMNNQFVRTHYNNHIFGERAILLNEPINVTAISKHKLELYSLPAKSFKSLLTNTMLSAYIKSKVSIEDYSIELSDLDNIKQLGKGGYGIVNLVISKKTGLKYAIKAINTIRAHNSSDVEEEKNILLKIDHPFIMKIVKSFKKDNLIFFLSEYINGKTIHQMLKDVNFFSKGQAQNYIASLILVIEYLHSQRIVYRDVKPENMLVNENGFLKVVDFGTAKEIRNNKTSTVIGTPAYMSPELIKGKSYSFEVDYWSIGVCLYQFCCGKMPFGDNVKDPMEIYQSILEDKLMFPSTIKDKDFIKIVSKFLDKTGNRLTSPSIIKKQAWFKDFDWKLLINDVTNAPCKLSMNQTNIQPRKTDKVIKNEPYLTALNKHFKDNQLKKDKK